MTAKVFMDIDINQIPVGRIVFGLYGEVAPRTSENFRGLCTGEYNHTKTGKPLHFKGTRFSRIIPGFVAQAQGVGWSIYGKKFDDETFAVSQNRPGILVMANFGRNTNQSQFYITTVRQKRSAHIGECGLSGRQAGCIRNGIGGNGCCIFD